MSDYKAKKNKYEKVSREINDTLRPILNKLYKKNNDYIESHNTIDNSDFIPPCGITERTEPLTPEEVNEYERQVETVASAIKENPMDYEEIAPSSILKPTAEYGTGSGSDVGRVRMKKVPFPNWLKDVRSSIRGYLDSAKGRKGMDYEEAIKGVIRKAKNKVIEDNNALYVLLDTSGSMWNYSDAYGNSLLKVFSSHFPTIAEEFKGQLWMVDDAPLGMPIPPENVVELEDFTKDTHIAIKGGGGTSFWGAFEQVKAIEHKMKKIDKDSRVTLLVLSDMGVDLRSYPKLIPESVIFVTLESVIKSNIPPVVDAKKYVSQKPDSRKLIGVDAKKNMR